MKVATDYTLTGSLGWVSGEPVSIRDSSLKELRALAQQRLGARAGELKTRQELIDALEASEPKKAPKLIVPLAAPLPEPLPFVEKQLPPEPVIWTGDAPLPQITARPLVKEFPPERLVWSAQVLVASPAPVQEQLPTDLAGRGSIQPQSTRGAVESPAQLPERTRGAGDLTARVPAELPKRSRRIDSPANVPSDQPESGRTAREPVAEFSSAEDQPEAVTRHFFLQPEASRLLVTYEDDRVLTFARDPRTLYAAWDFSASTFDTTAARGDVVTAAGVTVQSFAVSGPAGGMFIEALPAGVLLKIEIHGAAGLLGESGWVAMPGSAEPSSNVPSSVV